ncbi:STIP1 y and U box-containing protein 1 [Apophysomyces sp. BC1034]|nr:STIP1 y and U box-containing protein 1 [Apophysomyces sp. BC1015]KAG0177076.1 STIP1 y and U box-containing protein 1 [Apophysomyces sp. BC1021]KAG0187362.1 STIP1 y and U box-containing protein 1 [Apophysomyces sp. BC1034]
MLDAALAAYRQANDHLVGLSECQEDCEDYNDLVTAIHSNMAGCFLKMQKWEDAIEECKKVLGRDACNVKAYYRIGQACLETKDFDKGVEYLREGLQTRTHDETAHL